MFSRLLTKVLGAGHLDRREAERRGVRLEARLSALKQESVENGLTLPTPAPAPPIAEPAPEVDTVLPEPDALSQAAQAIAANEATAAAQAPVCEMEIGPA